MPETSLEHIRELIAGQGREAQLRVEGLKNEMTRHFDGLQMRLAAIDDKQAIANGRVSKMERALERVDVQIGNLDKADGEHGAGIAEINKQMSTRREHRRNTDHAAVTRVHSRATDTRWLSERDLRIVFATLGAVGALLLFVAEFLPKVKAVFQ